MCLDSRPEDLSRSRLRWFDWPALVFLHRPIRCKYCSERYFTLFGEKQKLGVMPHLWMHYAVFISLICVGVGLYSYQKDSSTERTQAQIPQTSQSTTHILHHIR